MLKLCSIWKKKIPLNPRTKKSFAEAKNTVNLTNSKIFNKKRKVEKQFFTKLKIKREFLMLASYFSRN